MPTYEYHCDACGHDFEKFHSITAEPIKVCPECRKKKVRRLIGTGAGMIFKGSGFYITDYRDAGYKDKAKADSGESKPAEAKTESKPAETKAETPAPKAEPAKKPEPAKKESKKKAE